MGCVESASYRRTIDLSMPSSSFLEGPVDVMDHTRLTLSYTPAGSKPATGGAFELLRGFGRMGGNEQPESFSTPEAFTVLATGSLAEGDTKIGINVEGVSFVDVEVTTVAEGARLIVDIIAHTP